MSKCATSEILMLLFKKNREFVYLARTPFGVAFKTNVYKNLQIKESTIITTNIKKKPNYVL